MPIKTATEIVITCLFTILFFVRTFAQIGNPPSPTFTTFQQITPGQKNNPIRAYSTGINDKNTSNRVNNQAMGYTPQPTQEEMNADYYNKLTTAKQKKTRELYSEINTRDNIRKPIDPKVLAEFERTKQELRLADTSSTNYKIYKKYFQKSYNEIVQMLSKKAPMCLKRAVFLVENPFYKNKLSYEKYCKQIDSLVFICKQIILAEGLSPKNYMACHYAIQKLFSEKIKYKSSLGREETVEPFTYDLSIYDAEKDGNDWTEQHVTRLINIKKGQCHSMPLLYLILAEELNIKAYLAIAPNHSYIKFGNQIQNYCFETTNGTFTSDEWIVSSGYVSPSAIKNQIYLAPLTKDQVVAECLVDLESGLEFLCGKSDFSLKCAETTLNYYPKSIQAILTISNVITAECAKTASKHYFPKYDEYYKYPELKKQFDTMLNFELQVEETGYQKISSEQYETWRKSANEEKERREHLKLMSKLEISANEK